MALADYEESSFEHDGVLRKVFKGSPVDPAKRGIVVVHELPGITPSVLSFADRLIDRGAEVWLPSLVGTPGQEWSVPYVVQSFAKVCVAKEFAYWASDQSPPITAWLRALARELSAQLDGKKVGALGMCFSGGFALAMAADPVVTAPVLSQPASPLPVGEDRRRAAQVSAEDLKAVVDSGCEVMGLRFTGDMAVPSVRFQALQEALGTNFTAIEIKSPDRALSIKRSAHSVLTEDLIDVPGHPTHAALHAVMDFFDAQL
ncbi:MAG: dienelactone hydrolase [Acidimicrobiales bacterium]|nr:dienelactone hydrolase [Acidimicrobiales bacterium]